MCDIARTSTTDVIDSNGRDIRSTGVPPFGQSTDWFRNTAMDCRIAEQCADDQGPLVMNITLTKAAERKTDRQRLAFIRFSPRSDVMGSWHITWWDGVLLCWESLIFGVDSTHLHSPPRSDQRSHPLLTMSQELFLIYATTTATATSFPY
eukprot:scaffold5276_cov180-Skeletonema_menzelii.AAC.2